MAKVEAVEVITTLVPHEFMELAKYRQGQCSIEQLGNVKVKHTSVGRLPIEKDTSLKWSMYLTRVVS